MNKLEEDTLTTVITISLIRTIMCNIEKNTTANRIPFDNVDSNGVL